MSEVTEFLAWRRGLQDTPGRLRRLLAAATPGPEPARVLAALVHTELWAQEVLIRLFAGEAELPAPADLPTTTTEDQAEHFLRLRDRTLALLAEVDGATLHREGRLPSGRRLDPWRLAGELAEHDVRHLARLRPAPPA